jgi:hypothetical protein
LLAALGHDQVNPSQTSWWFVFVEFLFNIARLIELNLIVCCASFNADVVLPGLLSPNAHPVSNWTQNDVLQWLDKLLLGNLRPVFQVCAQVVVIVVVFFGHY